MRKQTDTRHLILNLCINFKRSGYIKRNPKEVSDSRWPAHLLLHLLHFTGFFCALPTTPSPNTYFSPNLSNAGGPRIYTLRIADYVFNHMNMHISDYPTKSLNYKI